MENIVRFLHISKTGGSTLKAYLREFGKRHPDADVKKFNHGTTFQDVCKSEPSARIVFFVRDPISRFSSGFYSRMREGLPTHYRAWTPQEKRTFSWFKTPNELAEALSSRNPLRRLAAYYAMNSIGHIKRTFAKTLGSVELLEANRNRIGFILRQESYDADFAAMIAILGLDPDIELPQDDTVMHRAPSGEDRRLSDLARTNLKRKLAGDFPIHDWCLKRREEILKEHGLA